MITAIEVLENKLNTYKASNSNDCEFNKEIYDIRQALGLLYLKQFPFYEA
jgi:hypothetical protein